MALPVYVRHVETEVGRFLGDFDVACLTTLVDALREWGVTIDGEPGPEVSVATCRFVVEDLRAHFEIVVEPEHGEPSAPTTDDLFEELIRRFDPDASVVSLLRSAQRATSDLTGVR